MHINMLLRRIDNSLNINIYSLTSIYDGLAGAKYIADHSKKVHCKINKWQTV